MVHNPRFPHTCRIIRPVTPEPFPDEPESNSSSPFDESDETQENAEPQDVPSESGDEGTVLYEGICRGYNRDTTSDNGDVHSSYRMLALPLKQDEWTQENIPRAGDRLELQRFGYAEYGQVLDITPSNLGTHLLWKYVRN